MEPETRAIDVNVLYTDGCAATPQTIELVKAIATEMGIHTRVKMVLVESLEQATQLKFLGSPTVQVNGLDIDPSARANSSYGFT
jgi:3'-phosphoadenosine 5'-phosphosulfate sulfotransferase (PAPS reductase)/FAD synthetase